MAYLHKLFPLRELPNKALHQIRQTRAVQNILTPFGHSLRPKRWIFVIGCYNSGTTLLANMLTAHPEISGLPTEGVALTDALPRPEEFGWVRMWSQCYSKMRLEPGPGMADRAERIKRQWSLWYKKNAPNLLEKSIANAIRMPFLQEHFQPAYFIYIVRNGYAVAEGIRRKAEPRRWRNNMYKDGYPIDICANQWKVTDEVVSCDRQNILRFLQIYYEDLTANPKAVMEQITAFLGLSSLDSDLLFDKWKVHGRKFNIQNMNNKSLAGLTCEDKQKIQEKAQNVLSKYGY